MLHQLLRTISLYGRWSTSGSDRGIAHFLTATRNTIEGVGEKKRTNEQYAWVNSSAEGELCNIVHMQTNASVDSSETSTKLLKCRLDILSRPTSLSAPVFGVDWSLTSPFANCELLSPFLSHSLTSIPSPLSVTSRSRVQNPLSGFAPKQTKESSAWRTTYKVLHTHQTTTSSYP